MFYWTLSSDPWDILLTDTDKTVVESLTCDPEAVGPGGVRQDEWRSFILTEQVPPLAVVVVSKEIQSFCRRTRSDPQKRFWFCKPESDCSRDTHRCPERPPPEASAAPPRTSGRTRPLGRGRSEGQRSTWDSRSGGPRVLTFPVGEGVGRAEPHGPGAVLLQQTGLGAQEAEFLHKHEQHETFMFIHSQLHDRLPLTAGNDQSAAGSGALNHQSAWNVPCCQWDPWGPPVGCMHIWNQQNTLFITFYRCNGYAFYIWLNSQLFSTQIYIKIFFYLKSDSASGLF